MTTDDATLRAVEYPAEAGAMAELFGATSKHDRVPWFPTIEQLVNDLRRTGTFDPERDLQALDVGGRMLGVARHSWEERPSVVNHRIEVHVHPEHRGRGHGRRLLAWAEEKGQRQQHAGCDGGGSTRFQEL